MTLTLKKCTKCGKEKKLEEFHKRKRSTDGYRSACKECSIKAKKEYFENNRTEVLLSNKKWKSNHPTFMKEYHTKNKETLCLKKNKYYQDNKVKIAEKNLIIKYGITIDYVNFLLEEQQNSCAICKLSFTLTGRYHVDHNHLNGQVRKLLCRNCNHLLGNARETTSILYSAIDYLKEFS